MVGRTALALLRLAPIVLLPEMARFPQHLRMAVTDTPLAEESTAYSTTQQMNSVIIIYTLDAQACK